MIYELTPQDVPILPDVERDTLSGARCLKERLTLSTILDALREVERETAQRAQQPSPLPDNSLARILAEKRNREVFRRLVIVITILLLAGTGVTITLGHRLFSSKDNVSLPKIAAVPRKGKEINPPTVPIRQREEAPKPSNVVNKPDSEPQRLTKKEEPIPFPSRDETALSVMAKAVQKPTPQIPTKPSSAIEPRRSEAIIPDLELQAIVWSEDPKSCSAMINGRLVPLGGEVGGFTVDEIGRNYVSVKSGLRSGRLRMIGSR